MLFLSTGAHYKSGFERTGFQDAYMTDPVQTTVFDEPEVQVFLFWVDFRNTVWGPSACTLKGAGLRKSNHLNIL